MDAPPAPAPDSAKSGLEAALATQAAAIAKLAVAMDNVTEALNRLPALLKRLGNAPDRNAADWWRRGDET